MSQRAAKLLIDWGKIMERVPPEQMPKFLLFKSKSDGYAKRMNAFPEQPPKINWAYYQKNVPIAGMVDTFQKSYEGLKIPVPKDTATPQIDSQETEIKNSIAQFKKQSEERISQHSVEIERINSLTSYEQMTMEEYCQTHEGHISALDAINKPTFWPHIPSEQLDYKDDSEENKAH